MNLLSAMTCGLQGKCPQCQKDSVFNGFLTVRDQCPSCQLNLTQFAADDAPPYIVMCLIIPVVVIGMVIMELTWEPALWIHMAVWCSVTLIMGLGLLRPTKGIVIALQFLYDVRKKDFSSKPVD